jgi:hypothetical protein
MMGGGGSIPRIVSSKGREGWAHGETLKKETHVDVVITHLLYAGSAGEGEGVTPPATHPLLQLSTKHDDSFVGLLLISPWKEGPETTYMTA